MKAYTEPLRELSEYAAVERALLTGAKKTGRQTPVQVTGCMDSQKSHLVAGLMEQFPIRLIVTYSELRAKELCEDFRLYDPKTMLYPAKDIIFYSADIHGNTIVKQRLSVWKQLLSGEPVTVVTSIDGGLDRIPPLSFIGEEVLHIAETDTLDIDDLAGRLAALGYERQGQVSIPGEFAVRGGILDIFPLTEEAPVRIELFGDEIDSIRMFDVDSQRSIERISEVRIYPAAEYILKEQELLNGTARLRKEAEQTEQALRAQAKNEEAMRVRRTTEEFLENLEYCKGRAGLDAYIKFFCEDTVSFFDYFDEHT